jgi:hypothetical protein
METTSTTARPRRSPRVRGSDRDRDGATGLDGNYDLLTAALLGVAIGVGTTLLLRRGPSGRRPIALGAAGAAVPLRLAGRRVAGAFREPSRRKAIERQVRSFMELARDRIDDAVESELRDLRGAVKRQRKRLGL